MGGAAAVVAGVGGDVADAGGAVERRLREGEPIPSRPRVWRVMASRVLPKAMRWPSALEGVPLPALFGMPSAGLGRNGVMALNSHSAEPTMMSGM